ncbi:MAG: phage head closure protein [Defluviitaleaceae bacterium]|nr:phage head closure protein [Defluviitaleaceae bacterium]
MAKPINPGRYRHRITFFMPPADRDDYGAPSADWKRSATVWASKEPLAGRELYAAMSAETKIETRFRMRWMPGIDETMRLENDGELYDIISAVDADAANIEIVLYCKKVVAK